MSSKPLSDYLSTVDLLKIETAIITTANKTGLVNLANFLAEFGVRLVSTGNTAGKIREAGIPVVEIHEFLKKDESAVNYFDGIVKTLHPEIYAGIAVDKYNPELMKVLEEQGIQPIDMVVGNMYPYSDNPSRSNIDIGGSAIVRMAAKMHENCVPVPSIDAYPALMEHMKQNSGSVTLDFRSSQYRRVYGITGGFDMEVDKHINL
jgi:phosphoribosylaminoimidazolecarboxamide formyltransferase/IMP cyclohydrolase